MTYSNLPDIITTTAATVNDVIKFIFTAETYNNIIKNIMGNSPFKHQPFDDIKQDLMMYILDTPTTVEMYNKGQLRFWFSRITRMQLKSQKSKMYGRYLNKQKDQVELLDTDKTIDDDINNQLDKQTKFNYIIELIHQNINNTKQLKRNLTIYLMYYVDDLTIKQISEITTISQSLVFKYLTQARNWVQENVDKSLFTD